jgi:predicted DCC family thiol-disulfide oxidoreductase YuxK
MSNIFHIITPCRQFLTWLTRRHCHHYTNSINHQGHITQRFFVKASMHTSMARQWFCAVALITSLLEQSATGFQIATTTTRRQLRSPPGHSSIPLIHRRFASTSANSNDALTDQQQQTPLQHPVILFDGVCNFCNTWVDLLLRVDVNRRFKFAPLQSAIGKRLLTEIGKDADDISSVILIQPTLEYYDKSACVLRVVEELGPVAKIASVSAERLLPKRLRDSVYDTVAENRYNFMGKRDECRCGDPEYFDRFLS